MNDGVRYSNILSCPGERVEFDEQNEHVQELYGKLEQNFRKLKDLSPDSSDYLSIERRLEQFQQLVKHLDQTNDQLKELTRLQRSLNLKGHRIDFRLGGELNANLKTLDGQIHHQIERMERAFQTEHEFHHLEKEIESHLQFSTEQLKVSAHQHDKGMIYQTITDRLQQGEHQLNQLIHLGERLMNDLSRIQYEQIKRTIDRLQERLQALMKTAQQARGEYEHLLKSQQKLNEDLLSTNQWFRRLIQDFAQPLELNFSLNHVHDLQVSINVSIICI